MQINTLGTYTYAFLAFSMVLFGQLGEITATAPSNPSSSGSAPPLRGVSPTDYAAFYTLAPTFTCKSGALMLPYAKVNDNYCDCPDGSDEPGTSACSMIPGAKFYCANVGDDEMYIKSMFVDDGVCDCCDGSDEGVGRCKDTCLEDGKGKLVRLQASLKEAEEGMKEKEKVLKEARERRLGWEKRLEVLEGMESRVAQEKVKAEVGRKNAEGKLERARNAMDVDGSEDTAKEEEVEDVEDAYEVPDDAEDDETEEERAMRIASQWIPDVGKEDQGDDYELDEDQNDGKAMQDSLDTMEESLSLGLLDTIRLWIGDQIAYLTGKAGVSGELKTATARLKALEKKAIAARDEFRKKDNALREVEREMVDLKRKLGQKYGEGDAFLLISESCVEARSTDGKHTYKVCPFGKAEQLEGRRSTGVGRWEGFAKIGEEIAMVFTNGDSCWQGPRRSFTAILRCGPQDLLEAVSEPSKCEYSGVLKTPAFCSNDMLEMLRKEIRRRELLIDSAVVGKDQVHQEL